MSSGGSIAQHPADWINLQHKMHYTIPAFLEKLDFESLLQQCPVFGILTVLAGCSKVAAGIAQSP